MSPSSLMNALISMKVISYLKRVIHMHFWL